MNKIKNIFKQMSHDPVLCIAWILAIISAIYVHPDKKYISYIDFRSLGILWGLMIVIQGYRENSLFEKTGEILLKKVSRGYQLAMVLILMCFFGSMLITNDVALITFVPFAMMTLNNCDRQDLMIPVIVLQTIAANLGSMLTPVGNPQNLYIYGLTGMSITEFISTMLPYTLLTAILLLISIFILPGKWEKLANTNDNHSVVKSFGTPFQIAVYSILFIIALLCVLRIIPYQIMVIIILAVVAIMDGKILLRADYMLLITFIGFFIFTGNMERIPQIKAFLSDVVSGREFYVSLITSQFISNVPATLMLSDFAQNYKELLAGVNVGGLGTLIASMASLISFKLFSNDFKEKRLKYVITFTVMNLIFLAFLVALHALI